MMEIDSTESDRSVITDFLKVYALLWESKAGVHEESEAGVLDTARRSAVIHLLARTIKMDAIADYGDDKSLNILVAGKNLAEKLKTQVDELIRIAENAASTPNS